MRGLDSRLCGGLGLQPVIVAAMEDTEAPGLRFDPLSGDRCCHSGERRPGAFVRSGLLCGVSIDGNLPSKALGAKARTMVESRASLIGVRGTTKQFTHDLARCWGMQDDSGTGEKRNCGIRPCNTAQEGGEARALGSNVWRVEPRPHWANS